tara:strand:+ start:20554 stop:21516 length:963 start_codon:yes stop_codon:yes gene_type:complete
MLSSFAHEHSHQHDESHNWTLDKKAYQSTRMYKKLNIFSKATHIKKLLMSPLIEIDQALFKEKLQMFSGAIESEPGVKLNSRCKLSELEPTIEFLKREYSVLGYDANGMKVGSRYLNFVAKKKGTSQNPKVLVISSHIDSVCNAGANDNGSGTISALMIAKALKDMNFKHTLYFVGFDNEERGMAGSKAFAREMKQKYGENFLGNINLEMMATNSRMDKVFHVIDCDRADSNFMTDMIASNIASFNSPLKINEACTTRSDHSSFWNQDLPAIVLSENFFGGDSDRCYHRRCDVVDERMDFEYMSEITRIMAYTIIDLANL